MGNLIQVLLSSIKAKITPIWTKIKLFTNISFLRTRVFTKIRKFFASIFNVKPKDKKDYYGIGRWLVSKRLAFALVVIVGLLSLYYIFLVNPPSIFKSDDGIKTYKYNSIPLRFTKGKVRIKAKSGYVAYEGEVLKGYAEGHGKLMDRDGDKVYEGAFVKSKYEGVGTRYYKSGQILYQGEFADNEFNGKGILYRANGAKEYDGTFLDGMKDGEGILCDNAGNPVFTGNFRKDALLYTDFLGKTTAEGSKIYTGKATVFADNSYFVLSMPDISGVYVASATADTIEDGTEIEGVYVLKGAFEFGGEKYTRISEIKEIFGEPIYEGNSYITMPEAVCIDLLNQEKVTFNGPPELVAKYSFDDYAQITSYNYDYMIYLYAFDFEGVKYTFFTSQRNGDFSMYMMELSEEGN